MSNTEFMTHIVAEVCNYAIANDMVPDDTLNTIANNILCLLDICSFNDWKAEDGE